MGGGNIRKKIYFVMIVTAMLLFGAAAFVQAKQPENGALGDLWDKVNGLQEDVDELKAEDASQYEIYMKIDDIKGEAIEKDHEDWIELKGFDHDVLGGPLGGGGGGGVKPTFDDFEVTKYIDRSSPQLLLYACNGKNLKEVEIHVMKATGDRDIYMEYKLFDVRVTSVSQTGDPASGEDKPSEIITLDFGKVTWKYTYTDPDTGTDTEYIHSWDVIGNHGG